MRYANSDAAPSPSARSSQTYTISDVRTDFIGLVHSGPGSALAFGPQHVPLAPAGQDQRRVVPLVDLVPQVADVDVHDVRRALVVLVVQVLPDHRPRHHPAAVE